MAQGRSMVDKYSNILSGSITEGGTNTLTFDEINVGLNIFDKVGLNVGMIEWDINDVLDNVAGSGDGVNLGLSQSNQWSTVSLQERSIIQMIRPRRKDMGTPANAQFLDSIVRVDFSMLAGGGILISPRPLYTFVQGVSLGSAVSIDYRLYFTVVSLKSEDYLELLESRQFFG